MNDRLEALEVKVAYLERYASDLDEVLRESIETVERLQNEVRGLQEQIAQGTDGPPETHERPPHHDRAAWQVGGDA